MQDETPSSPEPTPLAKPDSVKSYKKLATLLGLLSIVLMGSLGYLLYTNAAEPAETSDTEQRSQTQTSENSELEFAVANGYPLGVNEKITTTMYAVPGSRIVVQDNPNYSSIVSTFNQVIASFLLSSASGDRVKDSEIHEASNMLSIYQNPDIDEGGYVNTSFLTWDRLSEALTSTKTDADCEQFAEGPVVFSSKITTDDKLYSGCIVGMLSPQSFEYQLTTSVNLVMTRGDTSYWLTGYYRIIDDAFVQLSEQKAILDEQGYMNANVAAREAAAENTDLKTRYDEFVNIIKKTKTTVVENYR